MMMIAADLLFPAIVRLGDVLSRRHAIDVHKLLQGQIRDLGVSANSSCNVLFTY
jgi:hypothetical protein